MTDTSKTSNGIPITLHMRVFTNDYSWGTVVAPPADWDERGWWKVKIDDDAPYCAGQVKTYNGERMTTVAPR